MILTSASGGNRCGNYQEGLGFSKPTPAYDQFDAGISAKKLQCACSGIRTQPSQESIVPSEKFNARAVRQATFERASLARAELRASALVPYIFGKGSENVDQMNGYADRVRLEQLTLRRCLIEVADQLL